MSIEINGWQVCAHSCFLDQLEELLDKVEDLIRKCPDDYKRKNVTKRLSAILKLAFQDIPQDPSDKKYRQGGTLGDGYKHWFRAKFFQQYRLFFRYNKKNKVIILGWVNDQDSKRAYESSTDAYQVFKKMLENGNPPDDWDELLQEAQSQSNRLEKAIKIVKTIREN